MAKTMAVVDQPSTGMQQLKSGPARLGESLRVVPPHSLDGRLPPVLARRRESSSSHAVPPRPGAVGRRSGECGDR